MVKSFEGKNRGITLVALVITIIILLILAGISIATLTGSGLFEKARLAEQKSKNAQEKEDATLGDYENKIAQYIDGSRENHIMKYELLGEGEISSTSSTITLNKSIKEYSFLFFDAHLNGKLNDIWVDSKMIPASQEFITSFTLSRNMFATVYPSSETLISTKYFYSEMTGWDKLYLLVYGVK